MPSLSDLFEVEQPACIFETLRVLYGFEKGECYLEDITHGKGEEVAEVFETVAEELVCNK